MNKKTFDIIEKISIEHSKKTFGYLNEDDLKNEIWAICLEKIGDFDCKYGELEHWLRVVVKNRLVNRFKDITKSVRSPCPRCPFYNLDSPGHCEKFGEEKNECKKWRNYQLSVNSRNSLLYVVEDSDIRLSNNNSIEIIITKEIKKKILNKISSEYLHDFNKLINSEKISKIKIKKLKKEVLRILEEN